MVQTDLRLTRLAIACRRHELDHGKPPTSASQLTPAYLANPLSCVLSGKPLTLEPQADGTLLLSAEGTDPKEPIEVPYPTPKP